VQSIDVKGYLTLSLYRQPDWLLATEPVYPLFGRSSSSILLPLDPPRKPVFGLDLDELFERDGSAVPLIVYQCILAVDLFGIGSKNIYRLSGNQSHVNKMRDMFDTGMSGIIT
jgi:hypothetical protein